MMDYLELVEKNEQLIFENKRLKDRIAYLEDRLTVLKPTPKESVLSPTTPPSIIFTQHRSSTDKIELFASLFKGRTDVFARRWQNKAGKSGYSPVCSNEWQVPLCQKPSVRCSSCPNKLYQPITKEAIRDHLTGSIVLGIYPLLHDESCHFLAIDFDGDSWDRDIVFFRDQCSKHEIPIAVERSRSGNGAHAWFFFTEHVPAHTARKFGTTLLTMSMSKRHEIAFSSYDRLFPNQDTMPKGGLGNLIALPLQKAARQNGNSVFIDEALEPYADQWAYLASVEKIAPSILEKLITKTCNGNEFGTLRSDDDTESQKPWVATLPHRLAKSDFPKSVKIVYANMLYVPKKDISQRALNQIKRLAAFKNPEFFRAQAMRMPTFGKPRVISCAEETEDYLCLPRGCKEDLDILLSECSCQAVYSDETERGKPIDITFNGVLREEQVTARNLLLQFENGILCGTTAFGKTVVALSIIAYLKVSTLIIVDRTTLLAQWRRRIEEFLSVESTPSGQTEKRHFRKVRKRNSGIIGQIGNGKNNALGIIDIALIQSLSKRNDIQLLSKNYGLVIIDECHHSSAVSFENVLKSFAAKFVFGLTATPTRKDGHHPIIFMQCGKIRYRDNPREQAAQRPFEHYIVPRFTSYRFINDDKSSDPSIQELYSGIIADESRNHQIVTDILNCYNQGRNCLVLSERTSHVATIVKELRKTIDDCFALTGLLSTSGARETIRRIAEYPADKPMVLVATGRYVGEGFDEPRLDTLFLTMPISWKGTLQQYAGRLHRLYRDKREVQIYDYIDVHEKVFQRMYERRLHGYASLGYKTKVPTLDSPTPDIIFDRNSFLPVYSQDILDASREIVIISPYLSQRRIVSMVKQLKEPLHKGISIKCISRTADDFKEADCSKYQEMYSLIRDSGIQLVLRPNFHQKFSIIDQKVVWYGSVNLLSFGSANESMMRIISPQIANELMRSIDR